MSGIKDTRMNLIYIKGQLEPLPLEKKKKEKYR